MHCNWNGIFAPTAITAHISGRLPHFFSTYQILLQNYSCRCCCCCCCYLHQRWNCATLFFNATVFLFLFCIYKPHSGVISHFIWFFDWSSVENKRSSRVQRMSQTFNRRQIEIGTSAIFMVQMICNCIFISMTCSFSSQWHRFAECCMLYMSIECSFSMYSHLLGQFMF